MSLRLSLRALTTILFAAATFASGCATHGGMSVNESQSGGGSGGSSDGSKGSSDGSKGSGDSSRDSGDSSKGGGDGGGVSDGSSDTNSESGGSSDSKSETSGTVTTRGQDSGSSDASGLLVTTGFVLLGASSAGTTAGIWLSNRAEAIEAHRRDIRMNLARGQGAFIDEIAEHLGLSTVETAALGALLKHSQTELDALLAQPEPLDDRRATAFLVRLVEVIRAEPLFRPRVEAVMAQLTPASANR